MSREGGRGIGEGLELGGREGRGRREREMERERGREERGKGEEGGGYVCKASLCSADCRLCLIGILLQELLSRGRYCLDEEESRSGNTPMHLVGSFLAALFRNFELSSHSLKRRRPSTFISRSSSSQSTHFLHSCQGFTQSQLLRLIISIYGGVPEVFEVFHCRQNTTEEDLKLFLNPKRATKRPFQYLILEVNRLPYQLQEVCDTHTWFHYLHCLMK